MRVLFISDRYPPHFTGGYEIACANIAEGLRRHGHEVRVLTSDFGLNGPPPVEPGIDRKLHYKQNATSSWQLVRWETADQQTVRTMVNSWKPDAVYAWSLLHLFPSLHRVLADLGVPCFLNIQDIWLPRHLKEADELRKLWYRTGQSLPKRVARIIVRTAFRMLRPDWLEPVTMEDLAHYHVVFCSQFRMEEHVRLGLPSRSRRLIYNGLDFDLFSTAPIRDPAEPLHVLFAGRLVREKGVHTVVEAIIELARRGETQFSLTVAGPPSHPFEYAKHLEASVQAAGLSERVRFLGQVPQDKLRELFGQHHTLVFPSVGDEGLPMTILEAMMSGIPVVGTTTGGSAELLRDGETGLTYPAGDAASLAASLSRLAADPALGHALAETGRRFVAERFALEAVVTETERAFREVLPGSTHSPQTATAVTS